MGEYNEFDDEEFDPAEAERPTHVFDIVIAVWCLIGCCVEAMAAFFNHVASILVAHRNYQTGQRDFADEVRNDLETISTEELT
jgi:hypothetical protein